MIDRVTNRTLSMRASEGGYETFRTTSGSHFAAVDAVVPVLGDTSVEVVDHAGAGPSPVEVVFEVAGLGFGRDEELEFPQGREGTLHVGWQVERALVGEDGLDEVAQFEVAERMRHDLTPLSSVDGPVDASPGFVAFFPRIARDGKHGVCRFA